MEISDITLANLSDLSYLNLSSEMQEKLTSYNKAISESNFKKAEKYKVTLSDFCNEVSMDLGKYIRGYKFNITDKKMIAMMEIINKYKEIVMVGYAFETPSKDVIVASKGSELGNGLKSWQDWLDNFSIAGCLEINQQKETFNFVNKYIKSFKKINIVILKKINTVNKLSINFFLRVSYAI